MLEVLSSVGVYPKSARLSGSNVGVGGISGCALVLVLGFLVIAGDRLSVGCLLKGYTSPNPDIRWLLGVGGIDA